MPIRLERIDPTQNMARYYYITISPDLFGCWTLSRQWGRIGSQGRTQIQSYPNQKAAVADQQRWVRRKIRRGYQPFAFSIPQDSDPFQM